MQDLHFARPCTLTLPNGETRIFAPGRHRDVPDEIAGHWFVQAHLTQDTATASVPETAPLQHEERIQVKAALDAAEGRAAGLSAERDAAVLRAEMFEAENGALKSQIVEMQSHVAHLEAEEAKERASDAAGEFEGKPYGIKRRHQGKFAVVKQADGTVVFDSLAKAAAEAKAREMNAQG